MSRFIVAIAVIAGLGATTLPAQAGPLSLYLPSPQWKQVPQGRFTQFTCQVQACGVNTFVASEKVYVTKTAEEEIRAEPGLNARFNESALKASTYKKTGPAVLVVTSNYTGIRMPGTAMSGGVVVYFDSMVVTQDGQAIRILSFARTAAQARANLNTALRYSDLRRR